MDGGEVEFGGYYCLKNEDTILPLKQLNKKKIAALSIGDGLVMSSRKCWANMIRSLALVSDGVLRYPSPTGL